MIKRIDQFLIQLLACLIFVVHSASIDPDSDQFKINRASAHLKSLTKHQTYSGAGLSHTTVEKIKIYGNSLEYIPILSEDLYCYVSDSCTPTVTIEDSTVENIKLAIDKTNQMAVDATYYFKTLNQMSSGSVINNSCLGNLTEKTEQFKNVALAFKDFLNFNDPSMSNLTEQCQVDQQDCQGLVTWLLMALTGEDAECNLLEIAYQGFPEGGVWVGWQDYFISRSAYLTSMTSLAVIIDIANLFGQDYDIIDDDYISPLTNVTDRTISYFQYCKAQTVANMDINAGRMAQMAGVYGLSIKNVRSLIGIGLMDWDPYQDWMVTVTDNVDYGADWYYKCFNCTGFINQMSKLPDTLGKDAGVNVIVANMPVFFEGNYTLTNNTEDSHDILDVYRQSPAGCDEIVNEIFDKYCVFGVQCSSQFLRKTYDRGVYMNGTKVETSNSGFDGEEGKDYQNYIVYWAIADFCEKDGAVTPENITVSAITV